MSELADGGSAYGATGPGGITAISNVRTDTRRVAAGGLFFALNDEQFDVRYCARDVQLGEAIAATVSDPIGRLAAWRSALQDTPLVLGPVASRWRKEFFCTAFAVTRSGGEGALKEMSATVFRDKGESLARDGTLNIGAGVPLCAHARNAIHGLSADGISSLYKDSRGFDDSEVTRVSRTVDQAVAVRQKPYARQTTSFLTEGSADIAVPMRVRGRAAAHGSCQGFDQGIPSHVQRAVGQRMQVSAVLTVSALFTNFGFARFRKPVSGECLQ